MMRTLKFVTVGDNQVGKTSMLKSYATDCFPQDPLPTVYSAHILIDNELIHLAVWDKKTYNYRRPVHRLEYQKTDVVLLCYSLIDSNSLQNIKNKWFPTIHCHCPTAAYILVGLKLDLLQSYYNALRRKNLTNKDRLDRHSSVINYFFRNCSNENYQSFPSDLVGLILKYSKYIFDYKYDKAILEYCGEIVLTEEIENVAKEISAFDSVLCSSVTREGLTSVFELAVRVVIDKKFRRKYKPHESKELPVKKSCHIL